MNAPLPAYFNCSRPEVVAKLAPKGARILDVGCAGGAMGADLLKAGASLVVGLERDEAASKVARTRLSAVHRVDLDQPLALPYPDGFFDAITCADVLEHLVDPLGVLRQLRRYLKDGGSLVCSIPNVRHQSVLLPLVVQGRFPYAEAGILDRTHLRFFTLQEAAALLTEAGFAIEGQVDAVSSPAAAPMEAFAMLVKALGGDDGAFGKEARAIQYLFKATPTKALASLGPTTQAVPSGALADPWRGSKPVRVLLAPDVDSGELRWVELLQGLLADAARATQVTIGIALPRQHLEAPPAAFLAVAQSTQADLLLTEAPSEPFAWERLLAGATLYCDTSGRAPLLALARKVGTEVQTLAPVDSPAAPSNPTALYLDLMKRALLNTIYQDVALRSGAFDPGQRALGRDWPAQAHTMVGQKRLDHLQACVETVLREGVPGDLIETGVWRGGACILMRAVLKAQGVSDRRVWVADSFEGLPKPDAAAFPADRGDQHHSQPELAVSLPQVKANFERYGLLDEQVVFLKGWFKDTLPGAPIGQLAIARLDGDMYESTIQALDALYAKLSPGGFLIVDDYGAVPACKQAVEDFRAAHGITATLQVIDWTGVCWRKA